MERERFMSSREWLWLWQWMRVRVCCFWQLVVAPWHLWLPAVVLALFVALSATHSQPHILALLLCWGYLVQYLYILLDHRRSELLSFNILPFVFALLLAWFGASALLQLPWFVGPSHLHPHHLPIPLPPPIPTLPAPPSSPCVHS